MTFQKTQIVRLFDVFVIGPFLLWYALKTRQRVTQQEFAGIIFIGITTILYNGYNYIANTVRGMPSLPF